MINAALQQQQAQTTPAGTTVSVSGPTSTNCTTGRYTGEPFGMNFKDLDLKDFFRLIHEISGLNVVLDPSVKGSVTIVLDDVPWDQALAIVLDNQWRSGKATFEPYDDVRARARSFGGNGKISQSATALTMRALESDPISVRITYTD